MKQVRKRALTAIKPTGVLHIGNYFGALKPFLDLQKDHDTMIFVANYHALTSVHDPERLRRQSIDIVLDYLAAGLDTERTVLYLQSDVPEVTELAWIFNCLTKMPYLQRAHAYKDAAAKGEEINVGTFDYPLLMAADILIQDADIVPVGSDQKQHIEITRDMAQKFNRTFNTDLFREPEELILDAAATVPGTDGRKMSKSYGNVIPLLAEFDEIRKAVMAIPTDSRGVDEPKDPDSCNVFALHKLFAGERLKEIEDRYRSGGMGYKESKELLVEEIDAFVAPLRKRRKHLAQKKDMVYAELAKGARRARRYASAKMARIREAAGVVTSVNR